MNLQLGPNQSPSSRRRPTWHRSPSSRRRAAPARAARRVGRPTAPFLLLLVPLGEEVVLAPLIGLGQGRGLDGWGRRSRLRGLGQDRLCAHAAGCGVAEGRESGRPAPPCSGATLLAGNRERGAGVRPPAA